MSDKKTRLKLIENIFLTTISTILALIISEPVLRILLPPIVGWGWRDSPRRFLATFQNDSPNDLGLRGQKFVYDNNDYVVLLVGDSQVEAATSSPAKMPEQRLEHYLEDALERPVKVFSIAASGWGQDQQLISLEKYYEDNRADLVLLWITPGNDFFENSFPDRSATTDAGPLKPTYRLRDDKLIGPSSANGYYKNFAVFQVFSESLHRLSGNEGTFEDYVLQGYLRHMPEPHPIRAPQASSVCGDTPSISQASFYENILQHDGSDVTLTTSEDFRNSRSHFSPFAVKRSPRDDYLVEITKHLIDAIRDLAASNRSEMFVFYPLREDLDVRGSQYIKCVQSQANAAELYPVNLDYVSILNEVVPASHLLHFNLAGGDELSISPTDRHLSDIGNDRVMKKVAKLVKQHLESD